MTKLSDKRNRELVAVLQKNILKLETTEEKLKDKLNMVVVGTNAECLVSEAKGVILK
ncbi:hypothetical protein KKB83_05560 [Patescibacteria group bacterium]|nr:hypothetical protein [Patescibacteria group bacterium]